MGDKERTSKEKRNDWNRKTNSRRRKKEGEGVCKQQENPGKQLCAPPADWRWQPGMVTPIQNFQQ